MKRCDNCGRENLEDARFCSSCGSNLESGLQLFLRGRGLEQLLQPLQANDFTCPEELHALTDDDFKELGISLGLRVKLKAALQELAPTRPHAGSCEEDRLETGEESNHGDVSARALANELSRLSRIKRVYLAPEIPAGKLSAATASYIGKSGVKVLLLYDVTVFQGAKDGLVIAEDGIYMKETFQPACYFPYQAIQRVQANGNTIRINGTEVLNCINIPSISVKRIVACISILSGLSTQ